MQLTWRVGRNPTLALRNNLVQLALTTALLLSGGNILAGSLEPESGLMEPSATEEPISEAEKILWLTDQLTTVSDGWVLHYAFESTPTGEESVEDEVELSIVGVNEDGSRKTAMHFFFGDRNRYVAPHEATNGNPVLGVYLQDDVYEMNRLTQGSWRYFHRKIKKALAHDATLSQVEIEFEGKRVPATRVVITPYTYDEQRDQFEQYADKRYEITVSEAIPGYLYEIYTVVPGETDQAPPRLEERLRLTTVDRPAVTSAKQD